ncbi:MAG: hypothetical protein ACOC33_04005 [bacterium]
MKKFNCKLEINKAFEILKNNEEFQKIFFNEYSKEERKKHGGDEFYFLNEEWCDVLEQDGEEYVCYHSYSDNTLENAWGCDFSIKIIN